MKKVFFTFAAILLVISACRKDVNINAAKSLVVGTWNQVNLTTKSPTGKYLKLNSNGSMESDVYTGYTSYDVSSIQLHFKNSGSSISAQFAVSADSLYIESTSACDESAGCSTLFAKQK